MAWLLYALGSALFAGLTAILAKIGVQKIDSTVATALRTSVVLVFTWIMVFLVGSAGQIGSLSFINWLCLILSGLATGVSWLSFFKALQLGDVNKVTPVDKSSILLTMLLAMLLLGEPVTPLKLFSMTLIGFGTYLMIEWRPVKQSANRKQSASGDIHRVITFLRNQGWLFYALVAAVSAALVAILAKIGMQGIESNLGTAIRTVVVLIMAWIVVLATGKRHLITRVDRHSGLFLVLSACATGASWLLYFRALQEGPASVVVPIDKLSIVITVAFSYLFLGEKLSLKSFSGLSLIVVGTLLLLV